MNRYNNVVWKERTGYWQVRLVNGGGRVGMWVSYNDVVWC